MATIKELKKQIEDLKKQKAKEQQKKKLEKELFNLKHGSKIKAVKKVSKGFSKMSDGFINGTTPKKKKGKKKKPYDPFENINFNAFS